MLECYSEIQDINELKKFLPYRPYSANKFGQFPDMKIRTREKALKCKYIQLNPPCMVRFITFDLDYNTSWFFAEDYDLKPPFFHIQNRKNGHAHLIYILRSPVCKTSIAHVKPMRYLQAIIDAYSEILGADPSYSGLLSKNPFCDYWYVSYDNEFCWNFLMDLEFLVDSSKVNDILSRKPEKKKRENVAGLGRNCYIFETVRLWSYREIRNYWSKNPLSWFEAVEWQCKYENSKFDIPLDFREVRGISNSISRWTLKYITPKNFSSYQRANVRRRWSKESKKQTGLKMLELGFSIQDLIQELEINKSTAYRWLKEATPEQVKQTLTEQREWEKLGISRATWYRQKKKNNSQIV